MANSIGMYPKDFIKLVCINEIGDVVKHHPFLSFALLSIGIEFIGKCRMVGNTWDIKPEKAFNSGKEILVEIDSRYEQLDLRTELRNGLTHTYLPKSKLALGEVRNGDDHFGTSKTGRTILVAEILYRDFVKACHIILETQFPASDKMNRDFLNTDA